MATFCPILRFDAAEKHFPVSVETFISSSLLLRQERPPEERQPPYRPGSAAAATGGDSGDVAPTRNSKKPTKVNGHRCGECGKKKGWSVPRKGDWTIVPTPLGVKQWSTVTLLDMQRLFGDRYRFRCGCVSYRPLFSAGVVCSKRFCGCFCVCQVPMSLPAFVVSLVRC